MDTSIATSFGKFNLNSILYAEAEARSIINFPEINAHLSKLRQENIILECFEAGKQEYTDRFSSNIDYQKYSIGATYFSLEGIIISQDEMKNKQIRYFIDHRDSQPGICKFTKYWSKCYYPFQNMN